MERPSGEEKEKKKKTGKKSAAAAAAPEPERSKDGIVEWRQMPHMLTMTATPIPRTLAMCEHGEMAISCIDEKPAGRLPIFTKILMSKDHHIAYDKYMVDAVKSGSQCYIILPLVEESKAERMERFKSAGGGAQEARGKIPRGDVWDSSREAKQRRESHGVEGLQGR
jgi:hypothetical protein